MELSLGFFEEIKDLLSNIDISIKWLASHAASECTPELKQTLDQIAGEAARGHVLFDKFVGCVRDEDPMIGQVQINELLDDLLVFLNRAMERHHIGIRRDYQASLPLLHSDRAKLRQVFQNLLLNALAALTQGGQIHLVTQAHADHIQVVVGDNGPGIAVAQRDKIFEPLFTTKPMGTGLGLSICRAILDQLGGSITLEPHTGRGAAFSVRLPLHRHGRN